MDLTLVAFYGPKTAPFCELINDLQNALNSRLGLAFSAYALEQVHATIVGLEGWRDGLDVFQTSASQVASEPRAMDLEGLLLFMREITPWQVRIGGFINSHPYPFTSRGARPYLRSFSLDGRLVVAMGWPTNGKTYPLILDSLRRECRKYNVVHKYHRKPDDIDNDFFFVLGCLDRGIAPEEEVGNVQDELRQLLSKREHLDVIVRPEDLSVVAYVDSHLPLASSLRYPVEEALARVTELKLLYREFSESCQTKAG